MSERETVAALPPGAGGGPQGGEQDEDRRGGPGARAQPGAGMIRTALH